MSLKFKVEFKMNGDKAILNVDKVKGTLYCNDNVFKLARLIMVYANEMANKAITEISEAIQGKDEQALEFLVDEIVSFSKREDEECETLKCYEEVKGKLAEL